MFGVYNKFGLLADIKPWRWRFEVWRGKICVCGYHKSLHNLSNGGCVFGTCSFFVRRSKE